MDQSSIKSYGKWHVAYHGTEGHLSMAILLTGIRASGEGCFLERWKRRRLSESEYRVQWTPKIRSKVWKIKSKYVQMVLQVRVRPAFVFEKHPGTLENPKLSSPKIVFKKHPGTLKNAKSLDPRVDPNFSNNELEWVFQLPPHTNITNNGILVYGLMLRVTDEHPGKLPQNKWWEATRPGFWDYF